MPPGIQKASAWYRFARLALRVTFPAVWKVRVFGRCHEPEGGGVLYICNHQSFLDPILVGFGLTRALNFMARDSLFRFPGFGRLIRSVNAFPVRRGTADTGALKEAMRRLKGSGQVVVFAEGTRTLDGRIGRLMPGVALLAQRAADWTVPVVIEGAFECWPRWQAIPCPGLITVRYGQAIAKAEAAAMPPDAMLDRVRRTMIEIQADMRGRLGKRPLEYDR